VVWLKEWLTDDWEAKLVALVLAFLVWYVIKDKIQRSDQLPEGWNMGPAQRR
jgi:diadenylate cyclase